MEEFAVYTLPKTDMPKDLEELKNKLKSAGLDGSYAIDGDVLELENEEGVFGFELDAGYNQVVLSGEFEDIAATLILVQDIMEDAFPNVESSTAFD